MRVRVEVEVCNRKIKRGEDGGEIRWMQLHLDVPMSISMLTNHVACLKPKQCWTRCPLDRTVDKDIWLWYSNWHSIVMTVDTTTNTVATANLTTNIANIANCTNCTTGTVVADVVIVLVACSGSGSGSSGIGDCFNGLST